MAVLKNRVGVLTSTTGTGAVSLGAGLTAAQAVNAASWQTFAQGGVANGDQVRYLILDSNGAWEYGPGTYSTAGTTLSRATGLMDGSIPGQKSSTGAVLSLSGTAQVFVTAVAEDLVLVTISDTPPASPSAGSLWWESDSGTLWIYYNDGNTSQWVAVGGGTSIVAIAGPPQGRLTLQSGVPVMTTTQAAKTTLFYTPYVGDKIPIYDGTSSWAMTTFPEISVLTTDTTKNPAAIGANKVNDWFVWSDAGTMRLTHSVDWTNDTTRAIGLARVNGILVNSAAITNGPGVNRGTYVGTTFSNGSSQLDWVLPVSPWGTQAKLWVWNCYNRRLTVADVRDPTTSWTVSGATLLYWNNNPVNTCTLVQGLAEDAISLLSSTYASPAASGIYQQQLAVDGTVTGHYAQTGAGYVGQAPYVCAISPLLGFHTLGMKEASPTSITITLFGNSQEAQQLYHVWC